LQLSRAKRGLFLENALKKMQTILDLPALIGDTECANTQYFLRKQAKPDEPKGESGFCFLHGRLLVFALDTDSSQATSQFSQVADNAGF